MFTLVNVPESFAMLKSVEAWKELFNWTSLAAYAILVFLLFKVKVHPIFVIILGAVFGIIFL